MHNRLLARIVLTTMLSLGAVLLVVTIATARPTPVQIENVEPAVLSSTTGGTLTVYGSGFISTTRSRLVGFGLLDTNVINERILEAVAPPGVPAGVYDLEVSASGYFSTDTDDVARATITILAPTAVPQPTPQPQPTAPPAPGRPVLTIRNFSVSPTRPIVGNEFIVTVEVYNTGSRGAENTLVTFPGGQFVPVGETGHMFGLLHINHTVIVTQVMRVPNGLASGTYPLQVEMSANDFEGNHYEFPESITIEAIGVGTGRPQLVIESAGTSPAVLGPGDAFSLTVQIANRGDRTASNVLVAVASPDIAAPADGSNVVAAGAVRVNGTIAITVPLVLSENAGAGQLNLGLALDYSDFTGASYSSQQNVGLEASTALDDRPQLIIASHRTQPASMSPGEKFTLTLELQNVGGGEAQRVTLALGGEAGASLKPFAPLDAGNVLFVPDLPAGNTVELIQQMVVDGSADPGAYNLPLALAYDDTRGTRHQDSQLISLLVRRRPHLRIGFYQPVGAVTVGQPFNLPVEVTNIGRTLINASTLSLTSTQLEIRDGSMYLGPLDGGTAGSLEAIAIAEEGGTAEIVVTLEYLDDFEQPQVITQVLTVDIEQPPEEVPSDATGEAEATTGNQGGFWNRVLRFLRGLIGLGS
ncbi:MAG: hypothetical protein GX620_12120 [Chloroflexi bacterium]|mgnify:CR=1 FL=1|nr:hypothetical protein [Chloroflexota bacterium]